MSISVLRSILCGLMFIGMHCQAEDLSMRKAQYLAGHCAACHGTDGKNASGLPALAGLNAQYFGAQMRAFQSGRRQATVMHQIARGYDDAQIEALARYFALQTP